MWITVTTFQNNANMWHAFEKVGVPNLATLRYMCHCQPVWQPHRFRFPLHFVWTTELDARCSVNTHTVHLTLWCEQISYEPVPLFRSLAVLLVINQCAEKLKRLKTNTRNHTTSQYMKGHCVFCKLWYSIANHFYSGEAENDAIQRIAENYGNSVKFLWQQNGFCWKRSNHNA